jgi:hypothetical protein
MNRRRKMEKNEEKEERGMNEKEGERRRYERIRGKVKDKIGNL